MFVFFGKLMFALIIRACMEEFVQLLVLDQITYAYVQVDTQELTVKRVS